MSIEAYLIFNGNCREAVEFYSKVFNTPLGEFITFGEGHESSDFPLLDADKNLIMHTELIILGSRVMFSDAIPGKPVTIGNNISLTILSPNIEEMKTHFNKLKEGGIVEMELQVTFWSKCYGTLTDKFGIYWQFNYVE